MGRKLVAIIILGVMLITGCATSLEMDRRGVRHTATPPPDAGITTRTIVIEASKLIVLFISGYAGARSAK